MNTCKSRVTQIIRTLVISGLLLFSPIAEVVAQVDDTYFILPELQLGKTGPANQFFPETKLQKSLFLSVGNDNRKGEKEWIHRLNGPWTGITLGYTDFGNSEAIGRAITLMPFIEFDIFPSRTRLKLHMGFGASRFDTKFDNVTNRFNRGISTTYTWSFRSFLHYDIWKEKPGKLRVGLGYFHQSNGHTKLPNQGLNSFALSLSSKIVPYPNRKSASLDSDQTFEKSKQYYFSVRSGIGLQVLTYDDFSLQDIEDYNEPKNVYSLAVGGGIIINRFLKVGAGVHYRFYEQYYDYIKGTELQPYFDAPFANASSYGIYFGGELLLSHVGVEFQMGVNFYKPFYEQDWILNEEELNWYYQLKKHVPARLGLKLYALNTNNNPKHNVFVGANINANLGQADFTELSLGYVRRFDWKKS